MPDADRPLAPTENDELAASVSRSRAADRSLAIKLERAAPAAARAGAQLATTRYLDALGRRPTLPRTAEDDLVAAAREGDALARARVVEAHMPLIASVARVYRDSPRVDRVELLQEGVVGLLRALERYDPARGIPFWGYAVWWVRHAMQQLVSELTWPVVLSDRALRQLARLKDAHRAVAQETGREPSRGELANRCGLSIDQVDDLLACEGPPRSTEETVAGEEGAVGTFGELIVDPLADGRYEEVLDAIEAQELLELLAGLSDRERSILRARYGLDCEPQSLREIGGRLGVSAARVHQIECTALGKLAAAAGASDARG